MSPTIVITRPEAQGLRFADQVRARLGCGVVIELSPLMRIDNTGDLPDLNPVQTLIFTSGNGVSAYLAKTTRRDIPCYCTGEATANAAREAGLKAISCGGTAGDLVTRIVADRIEGPCLHIRGEHGVGNVAERLSEAGILTDQVVLYRQVTQAVSASAQAVLQGEALVILPLFSPRSARIVFSMVAVSAPIRVVALSANVAAEVPAPFNEGIVIAERPDAEAMLDALAGAVATGKSLEGGNRSQ